MTLAVDKGVFARANRELLAQALSNLLDNALKYGVAPDAAPDVQLAAYRFGRVIRLRADEVVQFIDECRIEPGSLGILDAEDSADSGAGDQASTSAG